MSLRWIHENLEPPNVDEECSDIDDSCSDDSYDSDVILGGDDNGNYSNNNNSSSGISNNNNNNSESNNRNESAEVERTKHLDAAVTIDQFGKHRLKSENSSEKAAVAAATRCMNWNRQSLSTDSVYQTLKVKLFCRTGYFIGITSAGRVKGFPAESTNDVHVRLIICPVSYGIIRLRSVETGHYLAFNCTGHLYGESKAKKDNTEWEQWNIGNYDAFRSHKHAEAGWWLGVKRNGRHKSGRRTAWGQKAVQFLSIRLA